MTRPTQTLIWMSIFTIIVAIGTLLLIKPLYDAYSSNLIFNSIIVVILIIGIIINFRQVSQLYPEINWVKAYQLNISITDTANIKLLASMSRMLEGKEDLAMSTTSMRTILDSIRTRLEDVRDLSRYIIGVLVFLGLLGTFWGLMTTVSAIGSLITEMSVDANDAIGIFENLKNSLSGPLTGMGVAFSSSLFGLAGSLILGFLDLQAGQAQNRFVNELEEWLSSSTRISSGLISDDGATPEAPAYVHALLEKTANALEKMQRGNNAEGNQRELFTKAFDIQGNFDRFNSLLVEQNNRLDRVNITQNEIVSLLKVSAGQNMALINEDLREELRLLTKTIANALTSKGNS